MPFTTRITVRFGDCDPAGLVYYPVLLHYCHVAMEEFFAARCGIEYHRLVGDERTGFPTVKIEAEFLAPLLYGDVAEISVWVSRVGASSATFEYRLHRASDGELCAGASIVQVAMNLDERRSVPLPDYLRRAFGKSASQDF